MSPKRIIIAGGGTGGHVLAGIAVADAWRAQNPGGEVLFVGARGGIEEKLVPRANYPLKLLKLGSLNQVSLKKKLKTLFQLPLCFINSIYILRDFRPEAVLGVGGYASGPLVLMARLLGIRSAILEQNAMPGITNRILGKWVNRVFAAFPGTEFFFGSRVKVTGNPVRGAMQPMRSATRKPLVIFIFGGSQGAQGINTLVLDAVPFLKDVLGSLEFIHQTGEKDFDRVRLTHEKLGTRARVEKFIHDMPECYQRASLVICRSGSSTMAELAAVKRAAILVPFPFASDNHQEKNARLFVDRGAARLLVQKDAKGEDLAKMIRDFYENSAKLESMEESIAQFYKPQAAFEIAQSL
jgi:UDP-N-acetylglucosamine--N-acetylmuramyl-(pentapeptide) pyrophosphoryl-undecaprenol N-acetylglucosamine transferase